MPFISAGGTSLVLLAMAVALMVSVTAHGREAKSAGN
jgi:cell division protein FtsW (lipid II flippase)